MRIPPHQSYRRRKPSGARLALRYLPRLAAWIVLLYALLTGLFLRSVRVGSVSMEPALGAGDVLLASPLVYGSRLPWGERRLPGFRKPRRGDIVVVVAPQLADRGAAALALDTVLRFVTLQKATLWPAETTVPRLLVKRVVAVPGDTVRLDDYVAWIRPAGAAEWTEERELTPGYTVAPGPSLDGDVPFGGDIPEVTLRDGEYYLLGDNRADSSDSRGWGPVRLDRISAAVLLRYYPLPRFGRV